MTANTSTAPPGWHPDPSNPGGALRWWDGSAWTTHTHQVASQAPQTVAPAAAVLPTRPAPVAAPAAWPGGSATITPNAASGSYGSPYAANVSFAKRNQMSLTAIGVVALYVLIAMSTHFVFIGILPVLMSIRAIRAKETLAPAAVAAAIIAVLVAFAALH